MSPLPPLSVSPPKNTKELLERVQEIIDTKDYDMPPTFGGTGAHGLFLEYLLGVRTANSMDTPDQLGWEIKVWTPQTNYITLFHMEPSPTGIMRYMVSKFGSKDKEGRLSFRHTIAGKTDRFQVKISEDRIVVRPIPSNGGIPFWTHEQILSAAGAKLRRVLLVKAERRGSKVKYIRADIFENLALPSFIEQVANGTVAIDFDAREAKPGSTGLRNHGTKFRVSPENMCRIFSKKQRLS